MRCERCGEELSDNALFCMKCGTKTQQLKADQIAEQASDKPDTSGIDMSAYPTAVQPPVGQPVFQGTTPMPPIAEQRQGIPASALSTQQAQNYSVSAESVEDKKKSKTHIIIAIVVSAVAVTAIIVLIVTLMFGGSEDDFSEPARGYTSVKEQALSESMSNSNNGGKQESTTFDSTTEDVINSPSGYILPESDTRYYSESELSALSDYELYLARNEIYARHGREFNNQDLQNYFKNKDWYTARYSPESFDSIVTLNDYEKKNADAMLAIEKRRGSSYLS